MDTVITVDGFEYVLENGMYVNRDDNAYYNSQTEWVDSESHNGMKGICKIVGERYLVKYVFLKGMDSSLFRNTLSALLRENGNSYEGMIAEDKEDQRYIGGLFDAI